MIRGLYIAGTGMLVQRSKMDVITNNISNSDTTGYKHDVLLSRSFEDMLLSRMNDPSTVNQRTEVGLLGPGVHIDEINVNYGQGSPEQTGLATDLAITGDGYFVVSNDEGDFYTRAGNFTLTNDGYLIDQMGNRVQGEDGDIQLKSDRFLVKELGEVINLDDNTQVAKLRIEEFEDPQTLRKAGDNLFTGEGGEAATRSNVLQGYLESSNVNIAREMVSMLAASRAFESNQQAARMIDETLGMAVSSIAKF